MYQVLILLCYLAHCERCYCVIAECVAINRHAYACSVLPSSLTPRSRWYLRRQNRHYNTFYWYFVLVAPYHAWQWL